MNILIIKLGALGDFVLAVGAIMRIAERMREKHPEAKFTLMTGKAFLPIAEQMGIFSDYIIDNRKSYWKRDEFPRVMREVVCGDFDYIFDVQGSGRTRRKYFPALRLLMRRSFTWVHAYQHIECRVTKKCRWGWGSVEEVPCANDTDVVSDLSFLHGKNEHFHLLPERFVLMIPGCSPNHPHKRWSPANYAALACRLAERGISTVVIGTKAEQEELESICANSPMSVNMMGKTSIIDVPDLARRSLAVVGNDTGPTHIASLSNVPTLALYDFRTRCGATLGPRSENIVSDNLIDEITVERVWQSLEPFLN